MRRRSPQLLVWAILDIFIVSACVGYGLANPVALTGEAPPDSQTYPPTITITSPCNNTAYNTSRLPLAFSVTAPESRTAESTTVINVSYETSWKKEAIDVLHGGQEHPSFELMLSNIPEGEHNIVIKARGYGLYKQDGVFFKWFFISSSATIYFTVDYTAPTLTVLPPTNVSAASTIPLNFTVNEAYKEAAYSLNGQQNLTVSGNSTLPCLPAGQYNVTFYAWDLAGNVGASETADFTVTEVAHLAAEPADDSLMVPVAAVLSAAAILGIVLALKRRSKASKHN
ncbi:MAG: hypothetical protein NWE93_14150 [Candidatus Bathyarchaeota archaeon]|nr:hypothetical protein [Candidatus Bathyarchaeota archaeon]